MLDWLKNLFALPSWAAVNLKLEKIMSAISDYAAKQAEFNASLDADIDAIGVGMDGIAGDIKGLNDKIAELVTSPGDQALLDDLVARGAALKVKSDALKDRVEALDAQTPPVAPPAP